MSSEASDIRLTLHRRLDSMRFLAMTSLLLFAVASCSNGSEVLSDPEVATTVQVPTTTAPVATNLYGVWLTPDNSNHLAFNDDDTWSFSHAEDPERIRGFGAFTFDGELLTLLTDPASKNCSRNSGAFETEIAGAYEAAITSEGNLELTDVDDLCVPRKVEFRGALSSSDNQHQSGVLVPYLP